MSWNFQDLTGMRFGQLEVISRAENSKSGRVQWLCRCSCGNECVVAANHLRNGHSKSCGCLSRKRVAETHLKNLTGQKYGRLTVLERAENAKNGRARWKCRCDCGNEIITAGAHLLSGHAQSCGCRQKEIVSTHGLYNSSVHKAWHDIKQRCFNPNCKAYKHYGGRGISVYPAWIHDFQAFYDYVSTLEHFGESGYTLDRIDTNGNYEPGNLRWATQKEQCRNMRKNVIVEYNGKEMTLAEAAELSGINYGTLLRRRRVGDTGVRLFRPIGSK